MKGVKEEITRTIRKETEMNGNKYTTYQNLWGAAKAELRGKFIANKLLYLKKDPKSTTSTFTLGNSEEKQTKQIKQKEGKNKE